ncbi:hypothetical protein PAMP_024680 [Pampus punctatissimus]
MMDRRRMDAEGGRVVHRNRRAGKLAVVVAVQNLLVVACLVLTLCVHWDVNKRSNSDDSSSEDDVHIKFDPIPDVVENGPLEFENISSSKMMGLADKKKTKIYVRCTGPYILYMDVCHKSMDNQVANGTLELQVVGRETLIRFQLHEAHEVCRGLHSIVYLRAKEEATLSLNTTVGFKIKNVTVGLNYVLGKRCDY